MNVWFCKETQGSHEKFSFLFFTSLDMVEKCLPPPPFLILDTSEVSLSLSKGQKKVSLKISKSVWHPSIFVRIWADFCHGCYTHLYHCWYPCPCPWIPCEGRSWPWPPSLPPGRTPRNWSPRYHGRDWGAGTWNETLSKETAQTNNNINLSDIFVFQDFIYWKEHIGLCRISVRHTIEDWTGYGTECTV